MKEVTLIKFEADWCGPCQMMKPIVRELVEDLQKSHPNFHYDEVNVDKQPELAGQYDVASIPTMVVLVNGEQVAKYIGARPKNMIKTDLVKILEA